MNARRDEETPPRVAARHGHVDTTRLLLASECIQLEVTIKVEQRPLFYTLRKGYVAVAQLLIAAGADATKPRHFAKRPHRSGKTVTT